MSEKPEFKNWLTTGNLLTLGAMVVAISVAWGSVSTRLEAAGKISDDHEIRLRVLEGELARRLTGIELKLETIERAVK